MLTRTPLSESSGMHPRADPVQVFSAGLSPAQVVWRRKWAVLALALILTGVSGFVLKRLPVLYTASASVMVDARRLQLIEAQSVLSSQALDLDRVRTYIEALRSPAIAGVVVTQLGLNRLPAFCGETGSGELLRRLLSRQSPVPSPCTMSQEEAAEHLLAVVQASNDGRSYIIRITAQASDQQLAAAIANAYARAYVESERGLTSKAAEQADEWLSSYLDGMRARMLAADQAVGRYRRDNQLIPLRGETVVAQRLAELNSQLSIATSELAQKEAVLRGLQSTSRAGGRSDASAPAVLASPVVQDLIEKQSQLQASLAGLRTHYDESYPSVKAMAAQLEKVGQAIRTEMAKIISGLSQEVASLSERKVLLEKSVAQLQSATGDQTTTGVQLQDLQREAETEHRLYETMETRLHEIEAERLLQWPSSTVVVEAQPPKFPSFPRVKMMLTGIFIVSLGVGAVGAFGLELVSRTFRDIPHLEADTGLPVLGLFPRPPRGLTAARMVVDRPASRQTETLAFLLVNLSRSQIPGPGEGRVVLIASAQPGEGRSSLALALAQVATQSGLSIGLLDCDQRSTGLATMMNRGRSMANRGSDRGKIGQLGAATSMAVRSCASGEKAVPLAGMANVLLRQMRPEHDLVLIDAPSILAVSDALSLAAMIDDVILLVDLKRTRRSAVHATLRALRRAGMGVTGVVLSKVDLKDFARDGGGEGYYARHIGHARSEARARIDA